MRPTRRWWGVGSVGVVLLAIALVGERPLPLVGASAIGAFCLVTAARAVSTITAANDALAVDVAVTPERVPASAETTLTVTATLEAPLDHPVMLTYSFPPSVSSSTQTVTIEPGATQVRHTATPTFPVAGRFTLPDLSVTFESPDGLFIQRIDLDERVSVTAEAHGTGDIHVGAGGNALPGTFGSHHGENRGTRGDDFASLREYEPSDSVRRIDWKTTARLDTPHVREYESEREQVTRLVVDARSDLATGDPGRTKLDFIREVALGVLRSAEVDDDPLALTVVDDAGIRTATDVAGTKDHYQRIRETLLALGSERRERSHRARSAGTGPADAQATYTTLAARPDAPTAFETTLTPYFSRTGSYVAQLSSAPLFTAVQQHVGEISRGTWTVVLTDDTERGQLVETMKLATRGSRRATAFVTPTVLFEPRDIVDLEAAYDRLVEFEEFRKRLDRLPRATVYEVAPDDRLRAVLTRGRQARRQTRRRQPTRGRQPVESVTHD